MKRMAQWIATVCGIALVPTSMAPAQIAAPPVVVGYVPAFKGLAAGIAGLPQDRYTHINIAFANPDAAGRFVVGDRLACMADGNGRSVSRAGLRAAVAGARAKGARVLVSVAGGVLPGCSGDWPQLLAPGERARTVAGLVAFVEEFGLDGIDVDIEWDVLTAVDRAGNYTPFVAALADAMHARGKLITCATASGPGGAIPDGSIQYFDLVNVMAYDAIGPTWGQPGAEHSTFEDARRQMRLWLGRGVRRDRLVLGVPFYGYGFNGHAADWSYRDIRARFGRAASRGDVIGTACAGCAYITFNGPATLARKADLARRLGRGVMVWETTQDTGDRALLDAITRRPVAGAAMR